jgi:LmbE family N-acetylglucosaminyl deacetylase
MHIHDLRQIQDNYQHIYLSPHFDDAALSCGGLIASQRAREQAVLVVTVCTAEPVAGKPLGALARAFHTDWHLDDAAVVQTRRREDALAMATLDVDYLYLGLPDAIYRHPDWYDSRERLFGTLAPDDALPPAMLNDIVAIMQRAPAATVYGPLGVGLHVDHQAAHGVCEELAASGRRVVYYEDIPYVLQPNSLEQRLHQLSTHLLAASVAIDEWFGQKVETVAAYASQIGELFGGVEAMRSALQSYARSVAPEQSAYGERLWHRQQL